MAGLLSGWENESNSVEAAVRYSLEYRFSELMELHHFVGVLQDRWVNCPLLTIFKSLDAKFELRYLVGAIVKDMSPTFHVEDDPVLECDGAPTSHRLKICELSVRIGRQCHARGSETKSSCREWSVLECDGGLIGSFLFTT